MGSTPHAHAQANVEKPHDQGVVAMAAEKQYCEVEDILAIAEERGEKPLIVIADGVEDPHNLGAIIRCAECAGAHGVIISITSSPDIGLDEVEEASTLISNAAHPDANIIWGVAFDDTLQDEMVITVIATLAA